MCVMRSKLEVPRHFARGRLQSQKRAGVKVIAQSRVAIPIWTRVACAPIKKIQVRIVRTGAPGRAGSGFPTLAAPALIARLAFRRDSPEAPQPLAGLRVIRIHKAP